MKKWRFFFLLLLAAQLRAQESSDSISVEQVRNWVSFLAADSLGGRGNFSSGQQKAAVYIAEHFQKWNLTPLQGLDVFFHEYAVEAEEPERNKPSEQKSLFNVIGVLPGKSRPGECILFSAHYDHLGTNGGALYNGANDNASGTTALLALAQHYAVKGDNERTLIFCAFSGEELGLLGSKALAEILDPDSLMAQVNIEMIGRYNAVGKKAFFITGAYYSDFAAIFKKNLKGSGIRIRNEPYGEKELFKRSDNFPFASRGVPAHTLMSSDDDDPCYHQPCDDAGRIDPVNMTTIIRAIALGAASLVNGTDTPKRINPNRIP